MQPLILAKTAEQTQGWQKTDGGSAAAAGALVWQHRGDTAANWTSSNPTPSARQICVETDTQKLKVGDGATAWTSLPYVSAAPTGALLAASNLSDLANAGTARTNLGLGNVATRAVGTTAGTAAAGDDSGLVVARSAGYDRFARQPSGYYSATPGLVNVSNTAFSGASTGSLQFCPMLLTPGKTYDQLAVYCGTAQVGGTVTVSLGIYADDGNGKPLLSGGALTGSTGTLTLTATGVRSTGALTFVAPAVLVWGALLYVQTVAPSPYGATRTANSIIRPPYTEPGGSGSFGYLMTGQSSLPTSGTLADYATPTVIAARAV